MTLDQDRIRFKGKLIAAALNRGGSVEDPHARPFIEKLYEQWKQSGKSLDECTDWLGERLTSVFVSLGAPPVWMEEEPAWPFFDGIPMVFLSQTTMGDDPIASTSLSPGETVYLFAARQPAGKGFKMHYRTVSQFND